MKEWHNIKCFKGGLFFGSFQFGKTFKPKIWERRTTSIIGNKQKHLKFNEFSKGIIFLDLTWWEFAGDYTKHGIYHTNFK